MDFIPIRSHKFSPYFIEYIPYAPVLKTRNLALHRQPAEVQNWLGREVADSWRQLAGEIKWNWTAVSVLAATEYVHDPQYGDVDRAFLQHQHEVTYHDIPYLYFLSKSNARRIRQARQEVQNAEFLNMNEVTNQFSEIFAERGYGTDFLSQELPEPGAEAKPEEIYGQLFGPTKSDQQYLMPYLAVLARYEWKHLDPKMRRVLLGRERDFMGTGRLPELMVKRILDREMSTPGQRLETRARARIYWQVLSQIKTASEPERINGETGNEAVKRRVGKEIADFALANAVAAQALTVWQVLTDEERIAFGRDFDLLEEGLPESFLEEIMAFKDQIGDTDVREIVAHIRVTLMDRQEDSSAVSPPAARPAISGFLSSTEGLIHFHGRGNSLDGFLTTEQIASLPAQHVGVQTFLGMQYAAPIGLNMLPYATPFAAMPQSPMAHMAG